jgi:hypothetical protein
MLDVKREAYVIRNSLFTTLGVVAKNGNHWLLEVTLN